MTTYDHAIDEWNPEVEGEETGRSAWDLQTEAQLGILMLDGSGSMSEEDKHFVDPETGRKGSKADAVAFATRVLFKRLYKSSRAPDIYLSVLCYDETDPREVRARPFQATDAQTVDQPAAFWNPLTGHGGYTPIDEALASAEALAAEWLAGESDDLERSVVIVLLTDGKNNRGVDPSVRVERLKQDRRITIATVAYGADAEIAHLQRWATGESNFAEIDDAETLRNVFVKSLAARD